MELKTTTFLSTSVSLAKKLAAVTIIGFVLGLAFSQTNMAEASLQPLSVPNRNVGQAQAVANMVYGPTRSSIGLSGDDVPHDRLARACGNESACIAKKFASAYRHYGFKTKSVILTRTSRNSVGIQMRGFSSDGESRLATDDYHVVTIVWLLGGWRVVDPVVLQNATLEPLKSWEKRIASPKSTSISIR